jgi:hypothetical protein
MQTFDQALFKAVTEGLVSEEVAREYASSPHDFKLMLSARGRRASGMEQFEDDDDAEPAEEPEAAEEHVAPVAGNGAEPVGHAVSSVPPDHFSS